jgi:hypothetical protein
MTQHVWLILPDRYQHTDWAPAWVFSTWELAVELLKEDTDDLEVTDMGGSYLECTAGDTVYRIVAVPVKES